MNEYIGKTLGPYQVVEQIGQGGMATVFKAYHPAMDRYVALKILPSHFTQDETFVARFNQEARTLARLEHPHILPVYDYGEQDGITYLVMRYIDAGTLSDLILQRGALDLKETVRIMGQVARALGYAHSQGVIHRDIKPSNVLIDDQGNAFLTDFGIAKIVAGTAHFTGTGALIGTPAYMSPEQARGQEVDYRCDIYALGVMLYEMVTGRVPYNAETPLAVLMKHVNDPLPLPRQVKPGLPEILERVILKSLAKLPQDRFQTAEALAETLEKAVAGMPTDVALPPLPGGPTVIMEQPSVEAPAPEPAPQSTPAPRTRKRFPWLLVGGGIVLLLIIVLAGIFILPELLGGGAGDEDETFWQETVVDNAGPNFFVEAGDWEACPDDKCDGVSYGADFLYAEPGCTECVARFELDVPWEDDYTIWAWWPKGNDRATDTPYTVYYEDNELTVNVNQRDNGNAWYELASVHLDDDDWVAVYVAGSDTGYANADAIGLKVEGYGPPVEPGPYLLLPGPNGIVVDDVDNVFSVEGPWYSCTDDECGGVSYGAEFLYAEPGCIECAAYYYFGVEDDGSYDFWAWWPANEEGATDTPFNIRYADSELTVNVDQRHDGDAWYKLATLSLEEDEEVFVIVSGTETGYVAADAVALTQHVEPESSVPEPTDAPKPTSTSIVVEDNATSDDDVARDFAVGMVTDIGGIDDKSFNEKAWAGIERAMEAFDIDGRYLESWEPGDYAPNIMEFIDQDTDLIIAVGFLLAGDTEALARENPDTNFAIVDHAYDPPIDNVRNLIFNVDEAAFLAGYVAAAATETGIVATFGGMDIPPVVAFMVGFEHGVMYYNEQEGTDVEVLGWNSMAREGMFVGNFESIGDSYNMAQTLMTEGADVIMPVAGEAGLGAAQAALESGDVWIIGVDADWTVSAPEYRDVVLTSVLKNVDVAVFDTIALALEEDGDSFYNESYIGTLENGGVGLADIAIDMEAEALDPVWDALILGEIDTGWAAYLSND